ncbi:MAG TPA: hypothetical protein VJT31_37815 [Rugosimonospora sp.]|nr:hypothetical protein [Rugosimonospora sp.]
MPLVDIVWHPLLTTLLATDEHAEQSAGGIRAALHQPGAGQTGPADRNPAK